jgi:hypothetical protein
VGRMPLGTRPICRVCGTELQIAINWDISRCKRNSRICRDCNKAWNRKYTREYRERNPGLERERWWKARGIDISLEEYSRKEKSQDGKCAICRKLPKKPLVPDHNHNTGQVRDLLCTPCNVAISALECELTPKYQEYLEEWKRRSDG